MVELFRKNSKLSFIFILISLTGCASHHTENPQPAKSSSSMVMPKLVSPQQVAGSNLRIAWQSQIPLTPDEAPDVLKISGNQIYILSNRNFLTCMNRNAGEFVFSNSLTEPSNSVAGFDIFDDEIFAAESGRLITINSQTGNQSSQAEVGAKAICPPVRNELFYYIACFDERIRVLRTSDKAKLFELGAPDGSDIVSVAAFENSVIFTTKSGLCVASAPDKPSYLWKFNAEGPISGKLSKNKDSVFFASKDTSVYRLEADSGNFVWKCPLGVRLEQGPVVTQNYVYQYALDKGLSAIDMQKGRVLWTVPEGVSLLAEANDKAYIATGTDGIIVMDNLKRQQISKINISNFTKYAVNTTDSKIYLIDDAGRIACLKAD